MIMTIGMGAFSILGLILLYLVKGDKASKVIFYIMAVWGLVVAVFSALSAPSNWMLTQVVSWGFGFLSVGASASVPMEGNFQSFNGMPSWADTRVSVALLFNFL